MNSPTQVYDGLRRALATLNVQDEGQARAALVKAHAISWNEGMEISSALAALRSIFHKLDHWDQRQPK